MRHVKQSRRELYERLDRPALNALPAHRYEYAEWIEVKVNIDYHVSFEDHYYSAPYTMIHETLWCRATHHTIELLYKGKRIGSHVRSFVKYEHSTIPEHRPASHRAHPEQGYRSVLGILRLSNKFGVDRLERACERALEIRSPAYRTIKTMLQKRMEAATLGEQAQEPENTATLGAANIRGRRYYH